MAPPSPRRPGFSRRAQYSLFASYVLGVIGAVLGALLLITARFDPVGNAAIQTAINDLTSPIAVGARALAGTLTSAGDAVGAYISAGSKNRAMARELAAARRKLIEGQHAARENARLKAMLGVVDPQNKPIAVARLVGSTGANIRRYATLSAGAASGVRPGQPVRSADGLVGRVMQSGQISARVLLIIDGGNLVPVQRASDGVPALAFGLGDGRLEIRPLSSGDNSFKRGDSFVTSGTGGIYRPGIPVAIVVRQTRDQTIARPLADPTRSDFAIVEPEFVSPPPMPQPVRTNGAP